MADTSPAGSVPASAHAPQPVDQQPVAAALGLGWQMSSLYRRARNLDPKAKVAPGHLGGVSSLSRLDRFEMELDSLEFHLPRTFGSVAWTDAVEAPTTETLRAVLKVSTEQSAQD